MKLRPLLRTIDKNELDKYVDYIERIRPRTKYDALRRWLFAFCSIHTTWENNVRGYSNLADLSWLNHFADIRSNLEKSRIGLHNVRSIAIYDFTNKFFSNPNRYLRAIGRQLRNELNSELNGIGLAKISFAFELIDPNAKIICLDRHMLKIMTGSMSLNGKMNVADYETLEKSWVRACKDEKVHPVAARHYLWDRIQGKNDMRYWSYVFEL